jgi:monoamine oxidase
MLCKSCGYRRTRTTIENEKVRRNHRPRTKRQRDETLIAPPISSHTVIHRRTVRALVVAFLILSMASRAAPLPAAVDVVIVGAGLAGLRAAQQLQTTADKPLSFIVVEARRRLGGRILSVTAAQATAGFNDDDDDDDDAGVAPRYDLGPTWFWPGQQRMAALATGVGARVFEQHASGDGVVQGHSGAAQRDASAGGSMRGSYRVGGGMRTLVHGVRAQLPAEGHVFTRHAVTRIERIDDDKKNGGGGSVRVHVRDDNDDSGGGEHIVEARVGVIVAVPPRVAAAHIAVSPSLTTQQRKALENTPTWMGSSASRCLRACVCFVLVFVPTLFCVCVLLLLHSSLTLDSYGLNSLRISCSEVVAVYERPWWRTDGLSGDAFSRAGPLGEIHDASPPPTKKTTTKTTTTKAAADNGALFGFVSPSSTAAARDKKALTTSAVKQLVALFGEKAAAPVAVAVADWATAPLTSTAADASQSGGHPQYGTPSPLRNMWGGRLRFASSEMASDSGGFLEGALAAGDDAASRMLAIHAANVAAAAKNGVSHSDGSAADGL